MNVRPEAGTVASSERRSTGWRVVVVAAGVVVVFLVAWLVWGDRGPSGPVAARTPTTGTPVAVDRPAPPFSRALLFGRGSLSLARYEGRVVVLNFWASTCAPCRQEIPDLERLWQVYRSQGVGFVGVDYVDGRTAAIRFARSHGMSYPSVIDGNGSVGGDYGIFGLPTTYIIAPDGRIRYAVYGRVRPPSFRSALDTVVAEAAG